MSDWVTNLKAMQEAADAIQQKREEIKNLWDQTQEARDAYTNAASMISANCEIVREIFKLIACKAEFPYFNPMHIKINLYKEYGEVKAWYKAWDNYFENPAELERILNHYANEYKLAQMQVISVNKKKTGSYRELYIYAEVVVRFV